jgi:hypothetical protein
MVDVLQMDRDLVAKMKQLKNEWDDREEFIRLFTSESVATLKILKQPVKAVQ